MRRSRGNGKAVCGLEKQDFTLQLTDLLDPDSVSVLAKADVATIAHVENARGSTLG